MACRCKNSVNQSVAATDTGTDRYVSFVGIDCEGRAQSLMDHLLKVASAPAVNNLFWERFIEQYQCFLRGEGLKHDPLYLLHANVFYIRDLFEQLDDKAGLQALDQLEEECF